MVIIFAASLLQGCALVYATDSKTENGSVTREFGFLGGCLPLWRYQKLEAEDIKKAQTEQEKRKTEQETKKAKEENESL